MYARGYSNVQFYVLFIKILTAFCYSLPAAIGDLVAIFGYLRFVEKRLEVVFRWTLDHDENLKNKFAAV